MRNRLIAAVVLGGSALALSATPLAADAKPRRVLVCTKHSAGHNTRGTVIGAVAGGLLGAAVTDGKAGGTLVGAGAGAVAGHQIAKHNGRRCHYEWRGR